VRVASRFIDEIDPDHIRVESVAAGAALGSHPAGLRGAGRRGRRRGAPRGRAAALTGGAGARGRGSRRPSAASAASDAFPDYEDYSQEETGLGPGARVRHPRWGEGVVLEMSGFAGDAIVRVRFDNETEKRIMLRYGKLEVLSD
jgi:DNA helicase-2/ATP-dependent DNA helicase PcrA